MTRLLELCRTEVAAEDARAGWVDLILSIFVASHEHVLLTAVHVIPRVELSREKIIGNLIDVKVRCGFFQSGIPENQLH